MNVEYRRIQPDDAEGIARLFSEPEVLAGTLQLPMPNLELWRKRLQESCLDATMCQIVALVDGALTDGALVGVAGLRPVTQSLRTRHVMSLWMAVSRPSWGKGVGSELMRRLLDWADNWAGILRVELGVFVDNERAIRLYEKFGFMREGVQRAWALRDGQYVDSMMMARLHPYPPQLTLQLPKP
jgi:putative acetyltransferase